MYIPPAAHRLILHPFCFFWHLPSPRVTTRQFEFSMNRFTHVSLLNCTVRTYVQRPRLTFGVLRESERILVFRLGRAKLALK